MKRILSIAAVFALVFAAVSCQKDTVSSNEAVSFNVVVPAQPATRAMMSDGTTADELVYEVYVENELMYEGTVGALPTLTADGYTHFAVEMQLVKGQKYDILFWAQKQGTGFYNTADLRNVSTDYAGALANDENRDAFYGTLVQYDVAQGNKTVPLSRPFAQINCAITAADFIAAAPFITKGLTSKYVVSEAATAFNVFTGDVIAGNVAADVIFDYSLAPVSEDKYTNDFISINGTDYTWVAMAYLFAPATGKSVNLTAEFVHDKNDAATAIAVPVASVPVKRNYKTNIFGQMLSQVNNISVVVVPGFVNDKNEDDDFNINQ